MRIALIDPSLFTVPYDRALARGLAFAGHRATLYGRSPGPDDPDPGELELVPAFYRFAGGSLVGALPRRLQLAIKGFDHAACMFALRQRLRRDASDIIHFQWLPLPALDHRLLYRVRDLAPLVLTVHDTAPSNGDPAAAVRQKGFYNCLEMFDMVIVHTEQGHERLAARGIADSQIALLPHGLLKEVPPLPAKEDRMDGDLTFLMFGKIKPYKGVDLLIKAFAQLPPELQARTRVRIIGKPYMPTSPLEALAASRGITNQVQLEPRFVEDSEIPHIFGPGVVAVFPYREIEASGVLSLALAYGRPVIAARVGSFCELIVEGHNGLLTSPGDVAGLTAALRRMIVDRAFAAAAARHARESALAVLGWDEIGRRTAEVYERAKILRAATT